MRLYVAKSKIETYLSYDHMQRIRTLGTVQKLRNPLRGRGGEVTKRLHKTTMGGGGVHQKIRLDYIGGGGQFGQTIAKAKNQRDPEF